MNRLIPLALLVAAGHAAGCSSGDDSAADAGGPGDDGVVEETVFDPLVNSLDKARGAEKQVEEHTERLRSRIDALDAGDDDEP